MGERIRPAEDEMRVQDIQIGTPMEVIRVEMDCECDSSQVLLRSSE